MANESCLDENQVYYLRTVLGIENVLWPETLEPSLAGRASANEGVAMTVKWRGPEEAPVLTALFPVSQSELPLSAEAEVLIEKMIRAMKLDPAQVRMAIWPGDEASLSEEVKDRIVANGSEPVVLFGVKGAFALSGSAAKPGDVMTVAGHRLYPTFSLCELIEKAEYKRQTWVHLQIVMKEL